MPDKDLFHLDPDRLDEEWVAQPSLYHEHALVLAEAREHYERAKAERDLVAAELDREVRSDPARFGLDKVTEAAVQTAVATQKRLAQATNAVITARFETDKAQAVVDALEHRKKALENLVQLRLSDYFAEPRPPKGMRDKVRGMERDAAFGRKKNRGGS